jgi:hypothetical protein
MYRPCLRAGLCIWLDFLGKLSIWCYINVGFPVFKARFEELSLRESVEFLDLFGSPFHKFALTLRGCFERSIDEI